MTSLVCRDESRRQVIRDRGKNGIDYVDVTGTHLCVHFLTDIPPEFQPKEKGKPLTLKEKDLALRHIVIRGGRRITDIKAIDFDPHATDDTYEQDCLGIDVDKAGDWSTYTLCFVEAPVIPSEVEGSGCEGREMYASRRDPSTDARDDRRDVPLESLDPRYACVDFSFKIDCPAEIDCKPDDACPPPDYAQPAISYLAKDYATFRQLILDRLALLMPEWRERHVPDVGIAIVEVLAYVGDYLSYYQDAVATEAYLDTARQRISVRRHARLVDYRMHDGCNARAFLFLQAAADGPVPLDDVYFVTADGGTVFEPLEPRGVMKIWLAHNEIRIYTWGDQECCIAKGATRATLVDAFLEEEEPPPPPAYDEYEQKPATRRHKKRKEVEEYCPPEPPKERKRRLQLKPGDFLLFEELACAGTVSLDLFDPEKPAPLPDVDRTHRHVVRLTKVTPSIDPLVDQPVLEVEWAPEDAMPFMLCVSAIGTAPQCDSVEPLAVARGNILLVDHGRTIFGEELDPVPEQPAEEVCEGEDDLAETPLVASRYRPKLDKAPLTFAEPIVENAPATVLLRQNARAASPAATLRSEVPPIHGGDPFLVWLPQIDLLDSHGDDPHFVAEIDDEGIAHLRFGDGDAGRAVDVGMKFAATYRFGNGRAGLVGAESITQAIFRSGTNDIIAAVRNPLPSTGAIDPEPVAEVKMLAPSAFRRELQRAITGEDYATLTRHPHVQGAAGALVWSGSWFEANVHVDPFGTSTLSDALDRELTTSLGRYRRMGHDLRVDAARSVPLRLELDLCIKPKYLRAHVLVAVKEAMRKFFAPDNLTFGEPVYVSRIVAAVMAVDGVAEVHVAKLERVAMKTPTPVPESGVLKLQPNEIARLDNDPVSPENGVLSFGKVRGGR